MANGTNIGQQGWGQATAAMQSLMAAGLGVRRTSARSSKRRASPSKKRSASASKRRRSSASAKTRRGGALKKGSAAAKAWGRKMKALRRRK